MVDGNVMPMELQHLSCKQRTCEDYLGIRGLKRYGIKKWMDRFREIVTRFISALELDDVVIGGGNVNKLDTMPPRCRPGDNLLAIRGGFLLWNTKGGKCSPGKERNGANRQRMTQKRSYEEMDRWFRMIM